MKILATNVYVGPNIYAGFPVIRHVIDVGVLEQWPSVRLGQNFIDKLLTAFHHYMSIIVHMVKRVGLFVRLKRR